MQFYELFTNHLPINCNLIYRYYIGHVVIATNYSNFLYQYFTNLIQFFT